MQMILQKKETQKEKNIELDVLKFNLLLVSKFEILK